MKKGLALGFILLASVCCARISYATTFLQVYTQAARNDPVFVKAEANWQSQKMNLPIARSAYLPQLAITGNGARNYDFYDPPSLSTINDYNWSYGYGLTITQPIFDLTAWNSIQSASAVVKAATATYLFAQQTLMQRTAQAYFSVLKSYEVLYYTIQNKNAVWKQYVSSQKKYRAGLIAIMDMYDAQSRYDQVLAQEITARNTLSDKLENLHEITGHYYKILNGFNDNIPLMTPRPQNKNAWTAIAVKQNYSLEAQRYNVVAAMDKIKQQSAGNIPTLDFAGGYSQAYANDEIGDNTVVDSATLGLNLAYTPIQGGLVYASTKQARYNYVAASAELNVIYRQVVNQTHNSYTGVIANVDRVEIDKIRIISAKKALVATEAGLKVGARTMVDVLNDLTTLYQAQQQYVDDRYLYLSDLIDLKVAAGTLTQVDLLQMNHWLTRSIVLPRSDVKVKSEILSSDKPVKPDALISDVPVKSDVAAPAPSSDSSIKSNTAPLPAPATPNLTPLPSHPPIDKPIIPAPQQSSANIDSRILNA